jgi:hypothetical protein
MYCIKRSVAEQHVGMIASANEDDFDLAEVALGDFREGVCVECRSKRMRSVCFMSRHLFQLTHSLRSWRRYI